MRGLAARVAVVLLALAPVTASGDSPATVLQAIPGTDGNAIARFTMRFSEAMAPLGGGDAPITMECAVDGAGRWVDPTTYVWEYSHALPGDTTCTAKLKPGLKTLSGHDVRGTQSFTIDTGGPYAKAVLPDEDGGNEIEEGQTFFVATNGPVDRNSVASGAYCAVDGIGERIAVNVLPQDEVARVFTGLGTDYRLSSFLDSAGVPSPLPEKAQDKTTALANVVALQCRRPLPPGRDMALVWGASIRAPSGKTAGIDKRFDFTVRQEFAAKLTCSRVNAASGCEPVEPVNVEFTAPVPRAQAMAVRLDVGGGSVLKPVDDKGHDATLSSVKFAPVFPPSITAKLTIPADLKDESGRPLSNARRFPLDVVIAEAPPLVKFAAPFGILEAKQGGVLPVTVRGVEPGLGQAVSAVAGGTARIEADDGKIADWLRRVTEAQANQYTEEGPQGHKHSVNHTGDTSVLGDAPVSRMTLALPGQGRQFEVVGVPLSKPGFYVVELQSPVLGQALLGRKAIRYVNAAALVTDMAVHFKWGRGNSLAWVTSLDSGLPVAGASVKISDSCTGQQFATGTTGSDGRVVIPGGLPDPSTYGGCDSDSSHPLIVSARKGDDYSFVLTDWDQGIAPSDFDQPFGYSPAEPVFHTIFDRTLLRAGETVHMKHVYRAQTPTGFRSGGAVEGTLTMSHDGSGTTFDIPIRLRGDGIGESSWTPPKGAPMGDYSLQVKIGDKTIYTGQSVRVDEYRLPTMRASVSGPKEKQVNPKQVPIDMYVGYLSGGGAGHAPIKVRTAYDTLSDNPDGWDGWTFGGQAVKEGTVPLDQDDNDNNAPQLPSATTIPLALDAHGALRTPLDIPKLQQAVNMTVEMDYQDSNGETLTASGSVPIYTSAVRLGIKPDGWMQRAVDYRLQVAALDLKGNPIRGQHVRIALYTREILSARRRLIGGFYAFDNTAKTTRLDVDCSGTTDDKGLATCKLDPGVSGEVIAVATTTDADGNEARAVTSTYLAGDDDWWFGGDNGDRMDIVADQKSYHVGDVAHVQVRMPFRTATALVTVEREGVMSSFVTTLSGKDPVVNVPLEGSYAPDVFISVEAVRGRISGWRLWLADLARKWHLPFFSREGASPTALVDLAKPSYRIGMTKVQVGWEGHELHVAMRADRATYHIRDRARVAVQVLGPDGKAPKEAEIAFAAVDEALLQLSPNDSWNILGAMMGDRPLSVLTSTAQMQVVGKRHYGRKAVASGGGGGGDMSALTRADFRPVLLWRGRVKLDANGRAALVVPLADSLSAYKLVAVATAGGELFGTGATEIRTTQDLQIFSGIPPLVRSGDFYGATFTLRNGSDKPMMVTANVDVQPAIAHGHPLTVTIPAGGAMPVTWRLTAPEYLSSLRWTVTAKSADGRAGDRMQVDEQVIPAVPEETWAATFLHIGDGSQVPVTMPAGALPGRGGIEVALTSSPAAPLSGVRAYMLAYPFGCFEQRLSKAVSLDDRAAWTQQMADLPTYLSDNGLLRYWPDQNQTGSIALSAYALSMTAEAGLAWPEDGKAKVMDALRGVVDGRITEEGEGPSDKRLLRLAALAALARNGASTTAMLGQVAIPVTDMPTATLADWLVTLDKTPGADPKLKAQAEQTLRSRIVYEGTRLDLVDKQLAPWWMMISDDEMAIKALMAVTGRPGWEQDAPKMMIGVSLRQMRGHWDTTPANAWGTVAVRRFAAAYPGTATGVTTAKLGGQTMSRTWPQPTPMFLRAPSGPASLLLSHSSQPGPWATVSVKAAVPLTAPAFAGYRVKREVFFVERKDPHRLSRGDVLRVRLTVDAPVDRTWVVIEDPIPAGASIVSGEGGQSQILAGEANAGGIAWPGYVERGLDAWRGYFAWLPKGQMTTEYVVRVNGAGRFLLPPTRVEAMYSPEIHAELPNRPLAVAP
ncbi:alpha-2-macroglobulin [Sphingomonas sp. CGMCC 1.13654]|uniref:Alpha-2-macroglobulin n=1 Tax=Sphingomonas chungangi TaxID=2683589 RepID=A0A838LB82_9SPHN|nr:MG2 domain-containing protein [Sphingomonas chungangi]MBA2936474.1 alpha-2-macroglobulin [Sphingomonas chungangi]MVW55859.1 alpha-2-macroglobulin [Sphingomonas chungangi]